MCGILACFNRHGFQREDIARAIDALGAMRHRGPDGEGLVLLDTRTGSAQTLALPEAPPHLPYDCTLETYKPHSADLVLAHRRLSIFDLSSRGHQPMRDEAGNWIVFNGEIYNFWEIRDDLKRRGHAFETRTDTEVILAAYRQWGGDCLKRFNGMWAFVLFDAAEKHLFIAHEIGRAHL